MPLRSAFAIALFLVPATRGAETSPLPPSGLKARGVPTPGTVHSSPDRRFRWAQGAKHVSVFNPATGRRVDRIRLPPKPEGASRRTVLFAERGKFFCVVDEQHREIGLHLKIRRGAKKAMAMVVSSTLHLVDSGGRLLWSKRLRDKHLVGRPNRGRPLRIGAEGTLAILLQDADPYTKARPLLLVIDRRGKLRARLDYVDWRTIDEFALSADGRFLAVRGFGRIPELETWGPAAALYRTGSKQKWVQRAAPSDERLLRAVDSNGWACCLRSGGKLTVFGTEGRREIIHTKDAARRFGLTQ